MLLLAVVCVGLLHTAAAQTTYDCQCGFFVPEQVPGQIGDAAPIPFKADTQQVNPQVCNEPVAGNNTCKYLCSEWGRTITEGGFSLCDAQVGFNESHPGISRCYGGLYCEALYQDGRIPEGGVETGIRIYYRMPQCPDSTGHTTWRLGDYEYPQALCCSGIGTYDSCYDACACVKADPLRYCECGMFTTVQFDAIPDEGTVEPLPFKMVSSTVGDTPFSFCDYYEANAPAEECEAQCRASGQTYFANYSLIDSAHHEYNVDEGVTYGDIYCAGLRSRRIFFNQPINTPLRIYKRAPFCLGMTEWQNLGPWVTHPERLCCNADGEFEFPCPTAGGEPTTYT